MYFSISAIIGIHNASHPFPELEEWNKRLEESLPKEKEESHKWICLTRIGDFGSVQYEVMTQQEIDKFYKKNSRWDSVCNKLSLEHVFTIINNVVQKSLTPSSPYSFRSPFDPPEPALYEERGFNVKSTIEKEVSNLNTNDSQCGEKLKKFVNMGSKLETTYTHLKSMCDRGENKRNEEKKTLWGKIKWFVLSWFYETNGSKLESFPASEQGVKDMINSAFQKRMISEIQAFEKAVESESTSEINTANDVKRWLTKNHADKSSRELGSTAKDKMEAIVALNRLWGDINGQDLSESGERAREVARILEERPPVPTDQLPRNTPDPAEFPRVPNSGQARRRGDQQRPPVQPRPRRKEENVSATRTAAIELAEQRRKQLEGFETYS